MTTQLQWMCYDNKNDEVIALWVDYNHAEEFLLDNQAPEDNWVLFPSLEVV